MLTCLDKWSAHLTPGLCGCRLTGDSTCLLILARHFPRPHLLLLSGQPHAGISSAMQVTLQLGDLAFLVSLSSSRDSRIGPCPPDLHQSCTKEFSMIKASRCSSLGMHALTAWSESGKLLHGFSADSSWSDGVPHGLDRLIGVWNLELLSANTSTAPPPSVLLHGN